MKKCSTRILLALLTLSMFFNLAVLLVSATGEEARTQTEENSKSDNSLKVLLIEDVAPWESEANETVLAEMAEYDKVSISQLKEVELAEYGVIIFANDQPFETYESYKYVKKYLETFARIGGVIVFGACDAGMSQSELTESLPGDVTKKTHYANNNKISDSSHPIIAESGLKSENLQSFHCSHVSFDESSMPEGARVIIRESDTNKPTLIEYPLGKGKVIASGLTWEHNYEHNGEIINDVEIGNFAKIAMDDMFRYALNASNIDKEALGVISGYEITEDSHHIIVTDNKSTPIKEAYITIDGKKYTVDENGAFLYTGECGVKEVEASADGYRVNLQYYDIQKGQLKVFVLEQEKGDGKPYTTQATDTKSFCDLRYQTRHYEENSETMLFLKISANWNGNPEGQYVIFEDDGEKILKSTTGIFEFAPGKTFSPNKEIKLKLISENGTESETEKLNIVIHEKSPDYNGDNIPGFTLPDGLSGSVEDEEIAATFPVDFDLRSTVFPLRVYTDLSPDGIKTYKVTIGLEQYDFKQGQWLSFKQQVDKGWNKVDNILDTWDGLRKRTGSYTIQKGFINPKVDVIGYYECKEDSKGNIISRSGNILIRAYNKSTFTQLFALGPVPFYLDSEAYIRMDGSGGLQYSEENGWEIPFTLAFTPRVTASVGAGVYALASVGGMALYDGRFPLYPQGNLSESTIKYNIALRVQLLFVFDWRFSPEGAEKTWYPLKDTSSVSDSKGYVSVTPRDYGSKAGDSPKVNDLNSAFDSSYPNSVSTQTIKESIMQNTIPDLVEIDGEYLLIFQSDKHDRTDGNNVILMYSLYNRKENSWSEPVAVCEGSSSDLFAKTFVIDDELYVVWQKIRNKMTSTNAQDLLKEMSENIDISFAKWNKSTKTFKQEYVNGDKTLDMYPQLVKNGDNVAVVWVSNSENDATGMSGTFSFYISEYKNGSWTPPSKLFETNKFVSEIAVGYVNGTLEILYSSTIDGNGNIFRIKGGSSELLPFSYAGSGIVFKDGYFYFSSCGKVIIYDAEKNTTSEIKSGDVEAINSSFRLVNEGDSLSIVWLGVGEKENSVVYASVKTKNGWSDPIKILDYNGLDILYFDVETDENGKYHIICTDSEGNKVSLKHVCVDILPNTTLQYVGIDENEYSQGKQPITLRITNNGDKPLENLIFTVKDHAGKVYSKQNLNCFIEAGETSSIQASIDLSTLTKYTELDFLVYSDGEADKSDNSVTEGVGCVDVSVNLNHYIRDDKLIVAIEVSNNTRIAANALITITEDDENGSVLALKNIGTLTKEKSYVHLYAIDRKTINFNGKNHKYYYVTIDTSEKDMNVHNNMEIISVHPDEAAPSEGSHSHKSELSDMKYNDASHWRICDICKEPFEIADHVFDNACDTECNNENCQFSRMTSHDYSGKYDSECNVCKNKRNAPTHPVVIVLIVIVWAGALVALFFAIRGYLKKKSLYNNRNSI